ncbi:Pollen proteins Ole e I like [Musa troglodytarum]|uniref:Pollen proteins Ole e I like n=1 Tax=Musa troglodytarum TaxID=320322 RepID=A0A9E7KY08_9LILI|nr:Pollen proteins Ole e I like [Musa troglodytarum]URE36532.1 Pollen proteins Ole e I like [Musa troglodytarum]
MLQGPSRAFVPWTCEGHTSFCTNQEEAAGSVARLLSEAMTPAIFVAVFALLHTTSLCLEADPKPVSNVTVMGTVFCDACANNNFSRHGYFLEGVKVRVQCALRVNATAAGEMRVAVDRTTDRFGVYELDIPPVDGFECREGRGVDSFCRASLVESPSSLCDVPGLSSSTEHVAVRGGEGRLCLYNLNALNYRPSKKDADLCGDDGESSPSSANSLLFFWPPFGFPWPFAPPPSFPWPFAPPPPTEPTGAAAPALVPFAAAASVFPALPPVRSISTGVQATLTASSPSLPIPTLSSLYSYSALVFATAFSSFTSSIILLPVPTLPSLYPHSTRSYTTSAGASIIPVPTLYPHSTCSYPTSTAASIIPLPTLPSLYPHSTGSYTTSAGASIIPVPTLYPHSTCSYPTSTAASIIPFPVPALPSLSSQSTCSYTATSTASIDPFPIPAFPSFYSNSTCGYATATTSPSIFSFPISSIPTHYSIAAPIDPFPIPAFPSLYSNSTYGYATATTSPSIFSFPISSIPTHYSISWGTIAASISLRNPRTRSSLHPLSSSSRQP